MVSLKALCFGLFFALFKSIIFKYAFLVMLFNLLGVVIIAKSFNDDMDDYLDRLYGKKERYIDTVKKQKKKKPAQKVPESVSEEEIFVEYDDFRPSGGFGAWLSSLFARREVPQRIPEDLSETEANVLEEMEDEIEQIDEEIHDLEEVRESLWTRFLKSMRASRRSEAEIKDDLLDEVVPVIDEDVKSVLKVLHKWLGKLPAHEMNSFKASEDFLSYKAILEKYGLVKKEE